MNSQYQHAYCQVSGTPFEQGVQQGQELSDAIRRNLASVHRKLEQEKVDLQAYQAFVNQNLRFFQEQRPEMYEELQGIAQGSGLPLDDILLLNIPAYFLCESFRHITQECSMLCVRGQAAADGCTYIGTWACPWSRLWSATSTPTARRSSRWAGPVSSPIPL